MVIKAVTRIPHNIFLDLNPYNEQTLKEEIDKINK